MNERTISLKFDRKDFEEIYFRDNQASLFFSPTTKNKTITTIIVGLAIVILYYNDLISINNFGVYYFLIFIFLLCLLNLFVGVFTVIRWKKEILKYLKSMENYKIYELQLTDEFLNVNLDYQEEYVQWKEFKKIEANDNFVFLQSGSLNYLFPKKSMSKEDYIFFRDSIKRILTT